MAGEEEAHEPGLKIEAEMVQPHAGADSNGQAVQSQRRPRRNSSINAGSFILGVAGIVFLTKAASFLTPYKLYFTFSSFLYGDTHVFRWESLTIKLAIPCFVGFCQYYLAFEWMRITDGSKVSYRALYRYLARQATPTAQLTGFFSALLLAWPIIVYWDIVVVPDRIGLKTPFLFVYGLYFIAYAYFADLGTELARLLLRTRLPRAETAGTSGRLSVLDSIRKSLMGVIASAIATYLASRLGSAP
jgi:hypothetical protein